MANLPTFIVFTWKCSPLFFHFVHIINSTFQLEFANHGNQFDWCVCTQQYLYALTFLSSACCAIYIFFSCKVWRVRFICFSFHLVIVIIIIIILMKYYIFSIMCTIYSLVAAVAVGCACSFCSKRDAKTMSVNFALLRCMHACIMCVALTPPSHILKPRLRCVGVCARKSKICQVRA